MTHIPMNMNVAESTYLMSISAMTVRRITPIMTTKEYGINSLKLN